MTTEGPPGTQFPAGRATVADASALLPSEPLSVAPDSSVAELAKRLTQRPHLRTIFVVNGDNRLVGMIPLTRLVDDLFLRVAPEVFLRHALDPNIGPEDIQTRTARTAGELMEQPVFVMESTTIREASGLMREHHIESIPIVDEQRRVVGELDLIELLLLWLRTSPANSV